MKRDPPSVGLTCIDAMMEPPLHQDDATASCRHMGWGGVVFTKQNRNECTENSVALPSTVSGGQKIEPKMLE